MSLFYLYRTSFCSCWFPLTCRSYRIYPLLLVFPHDLVHSLWGQNRLRIGAHPTSTLSWCISFVQDSVSRLLKLYLACWTCPSSFQGSMMLFHLLEEALFSQFSSLLIRWNTSGQCLLAFLQVFVSGASFSYSRTCILFPVLPFYLRTLLVRCSVCFWTIQVGSLWCM